MHAFFTNKQKNSKWFDELEDEKTGEKYIAYFSSVWNPEHGCLGYESLIYAGVYIAIAACYLTTLYADKYIENPILYRVVAYGCLLAVFAGQTFIFYFIGRRNGHFWPPFQPEPFYLKGPLLANQGNNIL